MPSTALVFTLPSHRSHLIACLDVPPSPAPPSTSPTPQLDLFDFPHPPPHSSAPFHRFVSHLFPFPDVPPFSSPMPSTTLVFTLPSLHFPPLHFPGCPPIFIAYALRHTRLHPSVTSFPTSSLARMSPHFHRLRPPPHLSSPFRPFVSPVSSLARMSCATFHHSNLSVGSFHAHLHHRTRLLPSVASFPTSSLVQMSPLLPHRLLPLRSLGWTISMPSLHRTRLHPSITFVALYLLQRLKVRFPAASYPPPSSSNFSRRASLTSTLPLLLRLFTSNTSRCASLLLVSVQFLMGTIYLFRPSCSLQDHLRRHIFRQVLAYRQSRQFALWEINQMECKMCSILEGQLK